MKTEILTIHLKELSWSYYNGSGAGGQHRNKTDSCARCIHKESGALAKNESERSQIQNKRKAFIKMKNSSALEAWAKSIVFDIKGEERSLSIEIHGDEIIIFDIGKMIYPKRKKITTRKTPTNPNKLRRREDKKKSSDW